MREQKALITELRDKTQVSLNEKVRKEERQANDDRRLALENSRRKAKGLELLDSLDDEEEEKQPAASEDVQAEADNAEKTDEEENEEEDAVLVEAGEILLDYIRMTTPQETTEVAQRSN